jgi:hypothetical protein
MKEMGDCNHMLEELCLQSKSESFNFDTLKQNQKVLILLSKTIIKKSFKLSLETRKELF